MIRINLTVETLASARFGTSAVWETAASLGPLFRPRAFPIHRRFRELLTPCPAVEMTLLADLESRSTLWGPDALAPVPRHGHLGPLEQIAMIEETPRDIAASDLQVLARIRPATYSSWTPDQYLEALTVAVRAYWRAVLEPLWDRVTAIHHNDVAHHVSMIADQGLAGALSSMHRDLRLEDDTLVLDGTHTDLEVDVGADGLWFVPSVFRWPCTCLGPTAGPVVGYSARGAARVWQAEQGEQGDGPDLGSLLGRSRAAILEALDVPRTTSGLALCLGLAPATVSGHLSVLQATAMVTPARRGRLVYYRRTDLAAALVTGDLRGELEQGA